MNKTNLQQQLEAQKKGIYLDSDGQESSCFGFFDWFCKESSLERKAKSLYGNLRTFLKHNPQIDTSKYYVFFKNNCPFNGPLYDDFRICDVETGDVIWNVTPRSGHSGMAEVYWREKGFEKPHKQAETFSRLFK